MTNRLGMVAAAVGLLVIAAAASAQAAAARYDGHKVARVTARTPDELAIVTALTGDVWTCQGAGVGTFDARFTPGQLDALRRSGVPFNVIIDDVQALIDRERAEVQRRRGIDGLAWFENFKDYSEIVARLGELAGAFPAMTELTMIGKSVEDREMWALKVTGPGAAGPRPAIVINGCQHAREWGSPMVVMFYVDRLLETYAADPRVKKLLDTFEFYFVPVTNPDGYVYTWETDRMWRKNRRNNQYTCTPTGRPEYASFGVDLNRNWSVGWGTAGASADPCSDTFRGAGPFSEPEVANLRDLALPLKGRLRLQFDMHTYGQLVLSPWGWSFDPPPDLSLHDEVGSMYAAAIKEVSGKTYTWGQGSLILYQSSGAARDYFYDQLGALAWTIELRDTGEFGFIMPPEQIVPTAEENWEAMQRAAEWWIRPVIVHLPKPVPARVDPGVETPIPVRILSSFSTLAPGGARVFTRLGSGGAFSPTALVPGTGDQFTAVLPGAPCGEDIQFYIEAKAADGGVVLLPPAGAAAPLRVTARKLVVTAQDQMESDSGWTVGAPGDTATAGLWNRADPQPTAAQPGDDHTPAPGVACWVTDSRAGTSVGQYDVDGGSTTLTSPKFSAIAPGFAPADTTLVYWRWYSNNAGAAPDEDSMPILLSNDDGATWKQLELVTENRGAWVEKRARIADTLPPTDQMRLRVVARDDPPGSIVEAGLDDLAVEVVGCPAPCYANCNGDTGPAGEPKLDVLDFACFQNKYALGDAYADCNTDGKINVLDFACYQNMFALGCK